VAIIGIDATPLSSPSPGGIGTSLYETILALAALDTPHRFLLYAAKPLAVPFSSEPLDVGWPVRLGTGPTTGSNILWMQTGVNRLLREDSVDLFWSCRHLLPFRAKGIAKVATIQDFWARLYPEHQPLANRLASRVLTNRIARDADMLVTLSEATARDLERFCGTPRERVRVVPAGVDTLVFAPAPEANIGAVLERLGVRRPYALIMDAYNPRKNAASVVGAIGRLAATGVTCDLVALGRPRATAKEVDLSGLAIGRGVGDRLHVTGDVTRDDLVALMSGALAFVYPSVYEGFGMPVLEAMACGCPIVTSNISSLPEVAGDAALLVTPTDAGEIAAALSRLLTDPEERDHLTRAGLSRARAFTWRRTAEEMLAVFEEALVAFRARQGGGS
jgi:glycosyltransferase involved in cell wall biosynthesis